MIFMLFRKSTVVSRNVSGKSTVILRNVTFVGRQNSDLTQLLT